jgi:hypothetical protein
MVMRMGFKAKKTEHSGAKKGRGAFYGPKAVAKKMSSRRRRTDSKRAARLPADDAAPARRGST